MSMQWIPSSSLSFIAIKTPSSFPCISQQKSLRIFFVHASEEEFFKKPATFVITEDFALEVITHGRKLFCYSLRIISLSHKHTRARTRQRSALNKMS